MRELGFFNRRNFIAEPDTVTIDKNLLMAQNVEFVVKNREMNSRYLLNQYNLKNKLDTRSFLKCLLSPSSFNQKNLNLTMLADKSLHRVLRDSAEESYNFV